MPASSSVNPCTAVLSRPAWRRRNVQVTTGPPGCVWCVPAQERGAGGVVRRWRECAGGGNAGE